MNPRNRNNIINALILALFVTLLSVFALYNSTGGFGANDANADNSEGIFVYSFDGFGFSSVGETLGVSEYSADSSVDAYEVSGYKSLNNIEFSATNIPIGTVIDFCVIKEGVDSGVAIPLICDRQNLEVSSNTSWEIELPFGLLVEPDSKYYCQINVGAIAQSRGGSSRYTSISGGCELTFDELSSQEDIATVTTANPFSTWAIADSQLLPGLEYQVSSDSLELLGLYAAIGSDSALSQQKFVDICFNSDSFNSCLPGFDFSAGVDGKYNEGVHLVAQALSSGDRYDFSCRTQQGRVGKCDLFAYFKLDDESLAGLLGGPLDKRDVFTVESKHLVEYCQRSRLFYKNQRNFRSSADDSDKQISRCEAILSSSEY